MLFSSGRSPGDAVAGRNRLGILRGQLMTEIDRFASMLAESRRAVVFTGAGISTESGIPDFRGPDGLWTRIRPIDFQDFVRSDAVRQASWAQWFKHGSRLLDARPNAGHFAVARLVERGEVGAVITQNVDNLHQDAGVPESRVIELHGNASYARCLGCERTVSLDEIEAEFRGSGRVGPCPECGGIVKSAPIFKIPPQCCFSCNFLSLLSC